MPLKPIRPIRFLLTASVFLLSFSLPAAQAQQSFPRPAGEQPPPRDQESGSPEDEHARMEKDMAKRANLERQAQIKRDTDKLLQLATDLKAEVDKSNENVLALNVVKKAEEIEKLAHSVREKMKGQ